jgi:hypothetical protein
MMKEVILQFQIKTYILWRSLSLMKMMKILLKVLRVEEATSMTQRKGLTFCIEHATSWINGRKLK